MKNRFMHLMLLVPAFLANLHVFPEDLKINDDAGTAGQQEPVIAMHPNGPGVVAWTDLRRGVSDIFMQMFGRRGLPSGANQRVNDDAGSAYQSQPAVAMDAHGGFVIAWHDTRNGHTDIYRQRFAANGRRIGGNRKVDDNAAVVGVYLPAVAMNKRGDFVIVWEDTRISDYGDVFAQVYDRSGEPVGANRQVNAPNDSLQMHPDVAMLESGAFMVTWLDRRSGPADRIYARSFSRDGTPRQAEFRVSNHADPAWTCRSPSIAAGPDGTFAIVWEVSHGTPQSDVFGCLFDSSGQQITGQFKITDSAAYQLVRDPVVAAHPVFPLFGVAYRGMKGLKWDVYFQQFTPSVPTLPDPECISESTGGVQSPALSMMHLANTIFVWSDRRNGDDDIYAAGACEDLTMRTTVGSGFDHQAPISWEPQYGFTENIRYDIFRIESGSTDRVPVASVNPAERPFPKLMLDYIDFGAENGRDYLYAVRIEGAREDFMVFQAATPSGDGFSLFSNWLKTPPAIDGRIQPDEWGDAAVLENIANPDADAPVRLYVKNDGTFLCIAVDDPNDDFIDPANQMGFLFDEDNNGKWEPALLIGEGAMVLSNSAKTFTPYTGEYPSGFHPEPPRQAGGVEFAASAGSGHLQYEARISLIEGPLSASPGDAIGAGFSITDPGHFYGHGYGYAAEWPPDALWDAASTLGDLILASPEGAVAADGWPMPEANCERDSWAHHESALDVPFTYQETLELGDSAKSVLTYADPYLYLHFGDTTDSLTLMAYDPAAGTTAWERRFPGYALGDFNPVGLPYAVGDTVLAAQMADRAAAFDRITGETIWEKEGWDFIFGAVGIDGDRLYWEQDSLFCLDLHTGEILWRTSDYWFPASDHNRLYTTWHDSLFVLDRESGIAGKRIPRAEGPPFFTVDETCVYTLHRDSLVATRKTDLKQVWAYPMPYDDHVLYIGSPRNMLAVDDKVIGFLHRTSGENPRLIALDKSNGKFLWDFRFDAWTFTPTLANGIVYTVQVNPDQTAGVLRAFDRDTGTLLFEDASVIYFEQPVAAHGMLFVPYVGGVRIFSNNPIRTSDGVEVTEISPGFNLGPNYPNPFNPVTAIPFDVVVKTRVTLKLFDMLGREVAVLADADFEPGHHTVPLKAQSLSSVLYFYRIRMGDFSAARKMVILK
jgi:outer membrane protein assembly factor BamB